MAKTAFLNTIIIFSALSVIVSPPEALWPCISVKEAVHLNPHHSKQSLSLTHTHTHALYGEGRSYS